MGRLPCQKSTTSGPKSNVCGFRSPASARNSPASTGRDIHGDGNGSRLSNRSNLERSAVGAGSARTAQMYDANAIAYVRRRTRDTETGAAYNPPWIDALANVRHLACREGWRYHHVQANT